MKEEYTKWELTLLDVSIPAEELDCLAAEDIDGDGEIEIVAGGRSSEAALVWYRVPQKRDDVPEKNIIVKNGSFHVGIAFDDIDGDGIKEIVVGEETAPLSGCWMVVWYDFCTEKGTWERHAIDPAFEGGPHDILFYDIDGDGENELVTIACYTPAPGIFIFKRGSDVKKPWTKHVVFTGIHAEGLSIGDLDMDGRPEIVCGPDWFKAPEDGIYSGPWKRNIYASCFREMCRTALLDITGNGRPDILITESEYMDGYFSWYENRMLEDSGTPWIEHRIEEGLIYSHTLKVVHDKNGISRIYLAEMEQGGWNAPYNFEARLLEYTTPDHGKTWARELLHKGDGVCEAVIADLDHDGEYEIIGKSLGRIWHNPKVHIWKKTMTGSPLNFLVHKLLDRDKPVTGIDILASDVDGDGLMDIICANLWYKNPEWKRFEIPGVVQVIKAYDIDRDGKDEYIAIKAPEVLDPDFCRNLSSNLCWIKPLDAAAGIWEQHEIGKGGGDWPHGCAIGPILPEGRLALIAGYHSANLGEKSYPELFEIPDDIRNEPWSKKVLAEIVYGEEFLICDVDGDGKPDIIAGPYWLENMGDGSFKPYLYAPDMVVARLGIMDVNKDGRFDVVIGQEVAQWDKGIIPWSDLVWFENPKDPKDVPWEKHVIDSVRCAHSIGIGDMDNDGEDEIICGEHDPFWPYRSKCRLNAYKQTDLQGAVWKKYIIDSRFEHHDGAKVLELSPGRKAIISQGWKDSLYLHLWETGNFM